MTIKTILVWVAIVTIVGTIVACRIHDKREERRNMRDMY